MLFWITFILSNTSSGWNPAHDGQKSERSERFWLSFRVPDVAGP